MDRKGAADRWSFAGRAASGQPLASKPRGRSRAWCQRANHEPAPLSRSGKIAGRIAPRHGSTGGVCGREPAAHSEHTLPALIRHNLGQARGQSRLRDKCPDSPPQSVRNTAPAGLSGRLPRRGGSSGAAQVRPSPAPSPREVRRGLRYLSRGRNGAPRAGFPIGIPAISCWLVSTVSPLSSSSPAHRPRSAAASAPGNPAPFAATPILLCAPGLCSLIHPPLPGHGISRKISREHIRPGQRARGPDGQAPGGLAALRPVGYGA